MWARTKKGPLGPWGHFLHSRPCVRVRAPSQATATEPTAPMPRSYSMMADDGSMDYSVHEAWNEATNAYLVVILVNFALFIYAKRNKRKIMRIFCAPSSVETSSEPNFYNTMSKIRLRQQLEMYSISRKHDHQQPQNQTDNVQLSLE
ncbi:small integral membrane protein 19-like [Sorex araneus]|uniref:small integral membrane protein 19-like n=1 Tax=Sorex araneus TaxID=42254 RepID=UPI002433CC24|nr:small integral membrane protein 19-like [Sorex araneus]